ncbi:MAG TPA: hypothetical protein VGO46_05500 [Gemmatimonadaceae bacterium]|nr:hypothetical protein [Gemmatimonadaceae bacterium]
MLLALLPRVFCALAAFSTTGAPGPATDSATTAAVVAIGDELRAYYRDLHDRNWTSIVTHFYPAKVTARFAVPDTEPAWMTLAMPEADTDARTDAHGYCVPSVAIAIVGKWARVRARRCTGERDEAWFYVMSGKWKIIHLESGQPLAT